MSTLWSKWGNLDGQTVGYQPDDECYYIQDDGGLVRVYPAEFDDLIFQLLRLKRKVERQS